MTTGKKIEIHLREHEEDLKSTKEWHKNNKNIIFNLCSPYLRLPKLKADKISRNSFPKISKETVPCKSAAQQALHASFYLSVHT